MISSDCEYRYFLKVKKSYSICHVESLCSRGIFYAGTLSQCTNNCQCLCTLPVVMAILFSVILAFLGTLFFFSWRVRTTCKILLASTIPIHHFHGASMLNKKRGSDCKYMREYVKHDITPLIATSHSCDYIVPVWWSIHAGIRIENEAWKANFSGLNRVYWLHKWLGATAVCEL